MCRDQVGAGYEIKTPRTTVPKLLPLMEVGLKSMMLVNGISKLGRFFGLPLPTVLCTPPLYPKCFRYESRMSIQS